MRQELFTKKRGLQVEEPACPFCTQTLKPPRDMEPKRFGDFEYGACDCGAVYVHDVTGHNLGAAMVEALGFACNDDWDMAWDLSADEDYQDALLEHYDLRTHKIYPLGHDYHGNPVRGVLSFIRLNDDLREIKGDRPQQRFAKVARSAGRSTASMLPEAHRRPKGSGSKKRFSKRQVQKAVEALDRDSLVEMAVQDPLLLRRIQRLLYAADPVIRWKAVLMLGGVAGAIAQTEPSVVGDLLRRLLYSANDSAAANWGAVEAVGEIIRAQPTLYGSFVRHILGLLGDPPSRPAVAWAVGRIGGVHPQVVKQHSFFALFDLLESSDPEVRGLAAWALGEMGAREARKAVEKLLDDQSEFDLFDGRKLQTVVVGDVASAAIKKFEETEGGNIVKEEKDTRDMDNSAPDKKHGEAGEANEATEPQEIQEARKIFQEANLFTNRGQSLDALERYESILPVFERHGYQADVANVCEKMGDIHVMRGNVKSALAPYQRALAICEKAQDAISTVLMVEKVIDIYRHLEEWEKALPYFFRGLELVEGLKDVKRAALFLSGIGDIYYRQKKWEDALDAYQLAEKLLRNMGAQNSADKLRQGIEKVKQQIQNAAAG